MNEKLKDWREMLPLARAIYDDHPAGCCWHVVLDDGNYDSVEFCADYAAKENCAKCMALSPLALRASPTQMQRLAMAL